MINDDLGSAYFKVIAVIPVLGRRPLLKYTIERLLFKNGCYKVICVGDNPEDQKVCTSSGAVWVNHSNKPLGSKWNAGFYKAREFSPDACLYVGSSDWLSDHWLTVMQPYLYQYQMVGVPGMHLLDISDELRVCKWNGYTGPRSDESIGIGRVLSKELLNKIQWKPFDDQKDNSMDRSMKDSAKAVGIDDFMVRDERLIALSISTNLWVNKHVFNMHWGTDGSNGSLPSTKITESEKFLNQYFPEAKMVCESLKGMSVSL